MRRHYVRLVQDPFADIIGDLGGRAVGPRNSQSWTFRDFDDDGRRESHWIRIAIDCWASGGNTARPPGLGPCVLGRLSVGASFGEDHVRPVLRLQDRLTARAWRPHVDDGRLIDHVRCDQRPIPRQRSLCLGAGGAQGQPDHPHQASRLLDKSGGTPFTAPGPSTNPRGVRSSPARFLQGPCRRRGGRQTNEICLGCPLQGAQPNDRQVIPEIGEMLWPSGAPQDPKRGAGS